MPTRKNLQKKTWTNLHRDGRSRGCANVIAEKETTQRREEEPRFQTVIHQYREVASSIGFLITPFYLFIFEPPHQAALL